MTATNTVPVTMTYDQMNTVGGTCGNEASTASQSGDVRNVVEDCSAVMAAIGGRGGGNDDVTVTLTARQWDVAVAALDTWGLVAFARGDTAGAEREWGIRDIILS